MREKPFSFIIEGMSHIHEKIDFTVGVFIVYNKKVLLRRHDKFKIWMGTGGHIELDEDPIQAAVRESKEEVGLNVTIVGEKTKLGEFNDGYTDLSAPRFMYIHPINDVHKHINSIYFARSTNDAVVQGPGETSDEIRWFTMEDLQDPKYGITETMKYFAEQALKTLS
jgi:8-oxo-dGTP pyrophosphatase MutT (NUDIX family)